MPKLQPVKLWVWVQVCAKLTLFGGLHILMGSIEGESQHGITVVTGKEGIECKFNLTHRRFQAQLCTAAVGEVHTSLRPSALHHTTSFISITDAAASPTCIMKISTAYAVVCSVSKDTGPKAT